MKLTISRLVAEQIAVEADALRKEDSFLELGADSLDMFQIISAIEDAFLIEFEQEEIAHMRTIGDACIFTERALERKK